MKVKSYIIKINVNQVPMKSLNETGMDRFSLAQNTPDFFEWYKPGSIIIGLALWNLQKLKAKKLKLPNNHLMQNTKVTGQVSNINSLFPANVGCVFKKVQIPWQVGENVEYICKLKTQQ